MSKIGDVIPWHPDGPHILADGNVWLPSDGRFVSKQLYPKLYAITGDGWGKAPEPHLFALPKLDEPKRR